MPTVAANTSGAEITGGSNAAMKYIHTAALVKNFLSQISFTLAENFP